MASLLPNTTYPPTFNLVIRAARAGLNPSMRLIDAWCYSIKPCLVGANLTSANLDYANGRSLPLPAANTNLTNADIACIQW